MHGEDHLRASKPLYERALFEGDSSALVEAATHFDATDADLSLARGRVLHGESLDQRRRDPRSASADPREPELFERAVQLYREVGDERGEGEALFWVGCLHQVVRHDDRLATPNLERPFELATRNADLDDLRCLRHLGIAEHSAARLQAAKERRGIDEAPTTSRQPARRRLESRGPHLRRRGTGPS